MKKRPDARLWFAGLGLSTIRIGMKKLEKQGIIRSHKEDVDFKKEGLPLTAFILINIDVNIM